MDGSKALLGVILVLMPTQALALGMSLSGLLSRRVASKTVMLCWLVALLGVVLTGLWEGLPWPMAMTVISAIEWWRHRNDDDDDTPRRRRHHFTNRLTNRLPKPKAVARPVPTSA